jgi:hypothetical protein
MRFFIYRALVKFFTWLEGVSAEMTYRFNVCESCGESKYYSQPCVGRVITYKAVR